ncbi:hypothetical protein KP509_32G076700 [Ceratopteris richardii]|uniref:Uncharacterized protein n=1 Tax=Ceratopteris richardii TaxID=49495 RepID=A0A8T2QW44_CERRI|nr:hypothetical protein KP509_32G076700 [Ceratopteris richardii]
MCTEKERHGGGGARKRQRTSGGFCGLRVVELRNCGVMKLHRQSRRATDHCEEILTY